MLRFHLPLFGRPAVTGPDGAVAIRTRQGEALLAYLGVQPDRSFTRSHLASLLWEGSGEAGARRTLTTVLGILWSRLPALPLRATRDSLGWDPRHRVRSIPCAFWR